MPHESHRVRDQQGGLEYRTGYDGVWLWDTVPVLSPQASTCPGPTNVDKQHPHVKDRETELDNLPQIPKAVWNLFFFLKKKKWPKPIPLDSLG